MLDIVVSGGLAVLPSGPRARRHRRYRRKNRRDRRAGQPCRARRRTGRRRRGADRHPRRHRPACPLPLADRRAGHDRAPADRPGVGGQPRRPFRRDHDDDRLRARRGRRPRPGRDRAAAEGMGRRLPLRLRVSHDGAGQDRARDPAAAQGSGRGRAPLGQDLHDRHHAQPQGPHGRFRRHLGGAEGAGAGRRHRGDPRRGQRHRHAHVREAVPRGPDRLREHGRGAQHACPRTCRSTGSSGWPPISRVRRST